MSITTLTKLNAIFDGERTLEVNSITFDSSTKLITAIGSPPPAGSTIIDANGATLLPGLIDAHVHTGVEQLALALKFGVTTELEMMGHWTAEERRQVRERSDVADLFTADLGLTAPGGHPIEMFEIVKNAFSEPSDAARDVAGGPPGAGDAAENTGGAPPPHEHGSSVFFPPIDATVEGAVEFVQERIRDGADYIKIMLEEGSLLNAPGLPILPDHVLQAAVDEAHRNGKLVLAHALTVDTTRQAIRLGVDGLAHLFIDQEIPADLLEDMKAWGGFVTPCLCLNKSTMGQNQADCDALVTDPRVAAKLSESWKKTLRGSFNTYSKGDFGGVLRTVRALHEAGIDLCVGTDVSVPIPQLGGLAHGLSVHHEMRLFVEAGFTTKEALGAATSVTARRFGLGDRGKIEVGRRADLVLVGGNVLDDIECSLNVKGVWKVGVKVDIDESPN